MFLSHGALQLHDDQIRSGWYFAEEWFFSFHRVKHLSIHRFDKYQFNDPFGQKKRESRFSLVWSRVFSLSLAPRRGQRSNCSPLKISPSFSFTPQSLDVPLSHLVWPREVPIAAFPMSTLSITVKYHPSKMFDRRTPLIIANIQQSKGHGGSSWTFRRFNWYEKPSNFHSFHRRSSSRFSLLTNFSNVSSTHMNENA